MINNASKAVWVKRLLAPECATWKLLPLDYLRDVGGELLFECNFSLKTLPLVPGLPLFYRDVLDARYQIVTRTPSTKTDLENEINWNNQHITIAGKLVFYRSWHEAEIKYIKDLISKDGKSISLNVFQRTFGIKANFLQYLGLLNAIPMSWKKTFKASNNEEGTKNGGESPIVGIQDISSKKCRIEMTKKKLLAFMSFLLS